MDGSQKEEGNFFNLLQKEGDTQKGGGSNPGRNYGHYVNPKLYLQVQIVQLDEQRGEFAVKAQFDHPYPTTKIIWIPDDVSLPLVTVL